MAGRQVSLHCRAASPAADKGEFADRLNLQTDESRSETNTHTLTEFPELQLFGSSCHRRTSRKEKGDEREAAAADKGWGSFPGAGTPLEFSSFIMEASFHGNWGVV